MRGRTPTLHCDNENCDNWDIDFYEQMAHSVDGIRITLEERAPGWKSTRDTDICPECLGDE